MHIQSLLKHVHPIKGWCYGTMKLTGTRGKEVLEVTLRPHVRNCPTCSACGTRGAIYDHGDRQARRFQFVPLWAIPVILVYTMRRVDCKNCWRVVIERVPWAEGNSPLTTAFKSFLSSWAKRLSWSEVANIFRVGWDSVYAAVEWAVDYGRKHVDLTGISAIGVDEIARSKGHKYVTLVYQIDAHCRRLLWMGHERKEETLDAFFGWFGKARSGALKFVCSDMWKPYLNVIARHAINALNVLDRFHIVSNLGKAVDEVRRKEVADLRVKGHDAVLVKTRWILLKKPKNLTCHQRRRRADLLQFNLKSVRAYLLRLDFEHLWRFKLPLRAGQFLDDWCRRAMRSGLDPIKKMARSFRAHRPLILNYFKAKKAFSSGVVEGLNNKAKLGMRRAYGIKGKRTLELALFHQLGHLPEPPITHGFF
ncbi:MAG: ISL3 family transposase [Chthoniobacterales bacterium]|nr:ISL3 family transposase [Chthoniobacterales bacterium]